MPVARKRKKTSNHHHSRTKRKLFKDIGDLNESMVVDAVERAKEAKKPDRERGLYPKWQARRIDGSSDKGLKHEKCELFILDLDHDPHATPALFSYAQSAQADGYELLAGNLFAMIQPYIQSLEELANKQAKIALLDDLHTDAELDKLTDAEITTEALELLWAELPPDSRATQVLERVLTRFQAASTALGSYHSPKKVKRTRKKAVKDEAATDKSA